MHHLKIDGMQISLPTVEIPNSMEHIMNEVIVMAETRKGMILSFSVPFEWKCSVLVLQPLDRGRL